MTERKILSAFKKIQQCKEQTYNLEALLRMYHLNIEIIRFLNLKFSSSETRKEIKIKKELQLLIEEVQSRANIKSIINKKNLKLLKPWLDKMDVFFKTLKSTNPSNTKNLLQEGEHLFGILKISATKILIAPKTQF